MSSLTKLTLGLSLLVFAVPAQGQEDADRTVYGFYQQYLKRSPQRWEVRAWARRVEQGTMSLQEVQANLLGSPEYFKLQRNDPRRFVRSLYQNVLGRRPSEAETENWMNNYDDAGGDRIGLAQTFVTAAQRELDIRAAQADDGDRDRHDWHDRRDWDRRYWSRKYTSEWWRRDR